MKNLFYTFLLLGVSIINAQTKTGELETLYINKDVTTHIVSTEIIDYSDLSIPDVLANLPKENILAIRPTKENVDTSVLTVVCESYIKQYRLEYTDNPQLANANTYIFNTDAKPLTGLGYKLTKLELFNIAKKLNTKKRKFNGVASKGNGMTIRLNNIHTNGDYFFIDYTVLNRTNINYDVDLIKYKIQDKKITKSTTSQTLTIEPITKTNNSKHFKKTFRNIAVFDKFTIPENKVFIIELSEEQISGRKLELFISYRDLLNSNLIK